MNLFHATLLGLIQGLTEFIPISSTAHLLIAQKVFKIPSGEATFAFLVIIQAGTLISLLVCFWKEWSSLLKAMFNFHAFKSSNKGKLGWYLLLATLPALIAGHLLNESVQALFQKPLLEAGVRLLSASLLMASAEYLTKPARSLQTITWLDALIIGLFQVIAIFPGASRSGTTISGGMFRGLDRSSATQFAFLMSVPVMAAASGYEMLSLLHAPFLLTMLPSLAIALVIAAFVGWVTIRWLLNFLARHSLYLFAAYCAALGILILGIQAITQ